MKKNEAGQKVGAQLVSATDGSDVTSGTTTVYVTIDAGTQATGTVGSGAATHEGNGYWTYAPSQGETNGGLLAFTFVNSSAVSQTVQIYTSYPQTGDNYARLGAPAGASVSADIAAVPTAAENRAEMDSNSTQLAAIVADTNELQTDDIPGTLSTIAGYLDTEIAAILADTNELQTNQGNWATATGFSTLDAAGVRTALGMASADLDTQLDAKATAAALTTVDGNVDAIKAKTDSLNFGVTGKVDANITHVNETEVGGDGASGTEWGPA